MKERKLSKDQISGRGPVTIFTAIAVMLVLLLPSNMGEEAGDTNDPPVANAGEDVADVLLNDQVFLDGSNSTDEDIENCTWSWECTSHQDVDLEGQNSPTASFMVFAEETITFKLTVTDPFNETGTDSIDIIPSINQDPEIDPLSVSPADSGPEGPFYQISQEIEFNASTVSDPEGRELTFNWESDVEDEGSFPSEPVFFRKMNVLGWHNITLTVTDPNGGSSSVVKMLKVREDMLPPVADMAVRPIRTVFSKGEVISLDGTGTEDPNSFDTPYTMNITWSTNMSGGYVLGYGAILNLTLAEGYHNITMMVVDNDGLTSSDHQELLVENQAPEAVLTTPGIRTRNGENTVNVSQPAQFSGFRSSDPNGDELLYSWDFGDGNTDTGVNVTHFWVQYGTYNVTLVVDDGSREEALANDTVQVVVNSIPDAAIEEPGEILTGEPYTFSANGSSDEDGDELTYRWDLDGDGSYDQSGFNTTFTYANEGEITIRLRVDDGFAWSEAERIIDPRVPNEPPVARVKGYEEGADPILVELDDGEGEIVLDASSSYDPDDDVNNNMIIDGREKDNLTYYWDLDAESDDDRDGTKDNDFTEEGETVRVTLRDNKIRRVVLKAEDERGLFSTLVVEIEGNNPPEVADLRSSMGARLYVNSTVRFTSTASDDDRSDRNKLQYHWDFGDESSSSIVNGTGPTQSYTYDEPGSYTVNSWVTDGKFWASYTLTVNVKEFDGLTIKYPREGSVMSGIALLRGNVEAYINYDIEDVFISVDGGEWEKADNPPSWEYELNTMNYGDGEHTIDIKVELETGVEQSRTVNVVFSNQEENDNTGLIVGFFAILLVAVVLAVVLYMLLGKRSNRAMELMRDMGPPPGAMPPGPGPGAGMKPPAGPSLPDGQKPPLKPAEEEKPSEEKKEEKKKEIRIKCPACKKVFKVEDEGERPLELVCTHCGAKGTVSHVPGDKDQEEEEEPPEKEEEGPEPISIICPSCSGMFELDEVTDVADCPFCGVSGELDQDTREELKERFGDKVEDITVRCPSCKGKFQVKSTDSDLICPYCGASGNVPK